MIECGTHWCPTCRARQPLGWDGNDKSGGVFRCWLCKTEVGYGKPPTGVLDGPHAAALTDEEQTRLTFYMRGKVPGRD